MIKIHAITVSVTLAIWTMLCPAQAAIIQVNHVLDPANLSESINQEALSTPFTAVVGDTVEFDIGFLGAR